MNAGPDDAVRHPAVRVLGRIGLLAYGLVHTGTSSGSGVIAPDPDDVPGVLVDSDL